MSTHDEELQKSMEHGVADPNDVDARAYAEVFRVLKKDPVYQLSPGFANRVVATLAAKKERRSSLDYVWFVAGVIFLLAASAGTMVYTGVRFELPAIIITVPSFLSSIADYKGLVVFGVAFLTALNWLDKRFIRHRFTRNS